MKKIQTMKYFQIMILLIGLLVVLSGCTTQTNPTANVIKNTEVTKVRVGNLPVVQGLPLYVAMDKGYFAEQGIDVEIVRFDAPNQIIDALMNNQIDMGSTSLALGISAIADQKNPGKIKVYAVSGGTIDVPAENLIVQLDSNITKIEDLRGKKLGILAGTIQWRTITRHILATHGLDMDKDVAIVELTSGLQISALASGQVDAVIALEPIPTIAVSQGIAKIGVQAPAEKAIAEPFYPGAGVISVKFASEHPETAKKMINILDKAMQEINQNPEEYGKYLSKYTPINESITAKVPIPIFKTASELDDKDKASIQTFLDLFVKYGVVSDKLNFDNLVYKP